MSFFANVSYRFGMPGAATPEGSVILAGAMPFHQLERRKLDPALYPHMKTRIFDPQLYLSDLDPIECTDLCTKLATYPWFGISGLVKFDSGEQSQSDWKKTEKVKVISLWQKKAHAKDIIVRSVKQCVEFQARKGFNCIISPAPLTADPSTDFSTELMWLDATIQQHNSLNTDLPLIASVAITDSCLRFSEYHSNQLLGLILDAVSAREIGGVYLVIEQGQEKSEGRQCTNTRTLESVLHIVHTLHFGCGIKVYVNFMGVFGFVSQAAGAELWASDWYKSLYRFRLADKVGGGLAYPSFWSFPAATDINLDQDLDHLVKANAFGSFADRTSASDGLLKACGDRKSSNSVPAWQYRPSNVASAREHFLLSSINMENRIPPSKSPKARRRFMREWLNTALQNSSRIESILGSGAKTRTNHVKAWNSAFENYCSSHSIS